MGWLMVSCRFSGCGLFWFCFLVVRDEVDMFICVRVECLVCVQVGMVSSISKRVKSYFIVWL